MKQIPQQYAKYKYNFVSIESSKKIANMTVNMKICKICDVVCKQGNWKLKTASAKQYAEVKQQNTCRTFAEYEKEHANKYEEY